MSFALFYNPSDLGAIAKQLCRSDLPQNLVATATDAWDSGFKSWKTAPGAPYARCVAENDFAETALVVNMTGGLQAFSNLLAAIHTAFSTEVGADTAEYMAAIVADLNSGTLGDNSAAKEPWNGQ